VIGGRKRSRAGPFGVPHIAKRAPLPWLVPRIELRGIPQASLPLATAGVHLIVRIAPSCE
jgi:hypothetical protein